MAIIDEDDDGHFDIVLTTGCDCIPEKNQVQREYGDPDEMVRDVSGGRETEIWTYFSEGLRFLFETGVGVEECCRMTRFLFKPAVPLAEAPALLRTSAEQLMVMAWDHEEDACLVQQLTRDMILSGRMPFQWMNASFQAVMERELIGLLKSYDIYMVRFRLSSGAGDPGKGPSLDFEGLIDWRTASEGTILGDLLLAHDNIVQLADQAMVIVFTMPSYSGRSMVHPESDRVCR